MNSLKLKLAAATFAITSIFITQAQTSLNADGTPKTNVIPKTEGVNKSMLLPTVREGLYTDAIQLSADEKIIVVYISGAKGTAEKPEPYTAKQYGEMIQKAFGNAKYTNNPTDNVVVVHQETGKDRVSVASVLINGHDYKTKSGKTVFTPMMVGNAIDTFADAYAKTNSLQAYNPKGTDANGNVIKND